MIGHLRIKSVLPWQPRLSQSRDRELKMMIDDEWRKIEDDNTCSQEEGHHGKQKHKRLQRCVETDRFDDNLLIVGDSVS